MGPSDRRAGDRARGSAGWSRIRFIGLSLLLVVVMLGGVHSASAVQRNELSSETQGAGGRASNPAQGAAAATENAPVSVPGAGEHSETSGDQGRPTQQAPPHASAPHGESAAPALATHPEVAVETHKAETAHGSGGHGPALPEISSTPGVSFVSAIIDLMDYELNGRFLGWRPNDLVIGRFTDNVNNYQLGVLEAIRFTTLRLKDSLTRMGDADAYDTDLEHALNLFMNKATLFWFPSAESSYNEALDHLRNYRAKLESGQRNFYYRIDNLLSLINTYKDLLGNVNRSLIMTNYGDGASVGWFDADDHFYYAKGVSHVVYEILRVVRVGYKDQLATINAVAIMDEILHELHRAEEMDPWIILNGDLDGLVANHRANLNAPLSEVTHLLGVISRF